MNESIAVLKATVRFHQTLERTMRDRIRELEAEVKKWAKVAANECADGIELRRAYVDAAQAAAMKQDERIRELESDLARVKAEAKTLISPALRAQGTDSEERNRIYKAIDAITQNGDTTMMTRDEATRIEIDCLRQQIKEQADRIVNLQRVRDNAVGVACEPWRNHDIEDAPDADSPLYWVWEAAVESTLEQAHSVLGGNFTYKGGDSGDEGPEAAVSESFRNMFVARGIMDRGTHAVATHAELARVQAEAAAMREAVVMAARYHGISTNDEANRYIAWHESHEHRTDWDKDRYVYAKAFLSTAGRDLLERLERAEAIVGKHARCPECGKDRTLHPSENFFECVPCHQELMRLREFVARQPKTKDGVPWGVGDCGRELWYIADDGRVYCHESWMKASVAGMYSTRVAAEAALAAMKEGAK